MAEVKRQFNWNIFALLLLIAWFSVVIYLFPIPDAGNNLASQMLEKIDEKHKWILEEDFDGQGALGSTVDYQGNWATWSINFVIILCGVISAILGIVRISWWRIFAILPSSIYIIEWYGLGSTSSVSFFEAIELKWSVAKALGVQPAFFHKDIIIPLFFVIVIILGMKDLIKQFFSKSKNG